MSDLSKLSSDDFTACLNKVKEVCIYESEKIIEEEKASFSLISKKFHASEHERKVKCLNRLIRFIKKNNGLQEKITNHLTRSHDPADQEFAQDLVSLSRVKP